MPRLFSRTIRGARTPRTPRPPRQGVLRVAAAVAVGAVVATGSVAVLPAEPAQADWVDTAGSWISGIDSAIGSAGSLFGVETGPWNIALSLAGPLISSLFGGGGATGPSIQDVLDRLKQLDDIEHKIDVMQDTLADIQSEVIAADQHVLMGTCTVQLQRLLDYIDKLETAQADFTRVVDQIDLLQKNGGKGEKVKSAINDFIAYTVGSSDHTTPSDSPFAESIRSVHSSLITTGGGSGVIKTCGEAFFNGWRVSHTSKSALAGVGADQQGIWLDDRQYYEPLQKLVQYWQTASSQGVFLLQQASLMQATRLYVLDKGPIDPDDTTGVCALAAKNDSSGAQSVCENGLAFSNSYHASLVAEWKEVGLPLSDDDVVMSIGSDVSGLVYDGRVTTSAIWARNPSAFPADWKNASWSTAATPVTAHGVSGFLPANAKQWLDLSTGYVASHPVATPAVQQVQQSWAAGPDSFEIAKVKPFAPIDVLAAMRASTVTSTSAAGVVTTTHPFDATGVTSAWIPNEKATHGFPMFVAPQAKFGSADGLTFPPSSLVIDHDNSYPFTFYDDNPFSVKCFVAAIDGVVCTDTVGSWFVARQQSQWTRSGPLQVWALIPSDHQTMGSLAMQSDGTASCFRWSTHYRECSNPVSRIDTTNDLPRWLAPFTTRSGLSYEGDPTATATLWAAAPVPTECGLTSWGVPTRCGAARDAWLKATIPNPAVPGPVATSASGVTDDGAPGQARCTVPTWGANASEAGVAVQTGDVTWTGTTPAGTSFTTTSARATPLALTDFARKAGWYDGDAATRPASFSVRCTFTARYEDLATSTTVRSPAAKATLRGGEYSLGDSGGPAAEPEPVPGAPVPGTGEGGGGASGTGTGSGTGSGSGSTLAATGSAAAPWLGLAVAGGLLGAVLVVGRRRVRN